MKNNVYVLGGRPVRLLSIAILALLFVPSFAFAAGTITFVQSNYAVPQSAQTTVPVTFTAAQTAGNMNVVVVGWNDTTRTVSTVTDSKGNTYTRAVGPTTLSGSLSQSIYYAKNIFAAAAGSNTVTVTFSGAAAFADIRVLEYSGADLANPVDVTAGATGTSATANSGTVATTNANDLIFGASTVRSHNTGAGSGFTQRILTSPDGDLVEDKMVTTVASYNATAPLISSQWVMQMVAFRVASGVADIAPPTTPTGLVATPISSSQINLSWTASTDNVGVTNYLVERCQGSGCTTFTQIASPTGTSFSDSGLTGSTVYQYRVRATDAANNFSGYAGPVSATTNTAPVDTQAPTAPSNLAATAVSSSQVNLGWTASTDNVGVTNYLIEQCLTASCTFAQIGTSTTTSFSSTGLTANTGYSYRVRATDAAGNLSVYSNTANATTQAVSAGGPPVFVTQNANAVEGQGSAENNMTLTINVTGSNNMVIAAWHTENDGGFPADWAIKDNGVAGTQLVSTNGYDAPFPNNNFRVYYWLNPPLGTNTVTVSNPSTTANELAMSVIQLSNVAQASPIGQVATDVSASTRTSEGETVTTGSGDLVVHIIADALLTRGTLSAGETSRSVANDGKHPQDGDSSLWISTEPGGSPTTNVGSSGWATRVMNSAAIVVHGFGPDTQAPTAPTNFAATTVSGSQINLSWTAATDNVGVTNYLVEQCLDSSCTFSQVGTTTGTTFNATGLNSGTAYDFRVRATDAAGNLGSYSNTASATTTAVDTQAPTAPSNLGATAISTSQINLNWSAATDNVGVTNYLVERCLTSSCTFAQIGTTASTTFSSTGLTAGTGYSYRVRATDAAGNLGSYSNTASATTTAASDTQAPTAPSNLGATTISTSQINLSWTAATDNVGVTNYLVERCVTSSCTFAQIGTSAGTTFSSTGLTAGTGYSYRVRATDAAGNLGPYSNTATATTTSTDTQAPTAPSNLTATTASSSQVNLSWTASTDDVGVTNYLVERCVTASCTFTQVGTSASTTFNATALTANTNYSFRVRATDAAANLSAYSNTATATTSAAPSGLVAAYAFSEGSGTTVADLSGNNLTGTIQGATWTTGGMYGSALSFNGTTSYVDLGNPTQLQLTSSMTIEAWVKAAANPADDGQIVAKANNNSGWQLKTTPDTGPQTFGIAVSGSSTGNTQRYSTTTRALNTWYHVAGVYDATAKTLSTYVNGVLSNGSLVGTIPASQFNSTVNANIGRRTNGYYFNGVIDEVRIYNRALSVAEIQSDMNSPLGVVTPPADTTPPTAPSNLTATPASSSQINLSWTASTDNVGVTSYLVERCTGTGCSTYTQIAAPTTTTFSDSSLAAGTAYGYRVRAIDAAGNLSSYSNTVTATTLAGDTQSPTTPTNLVATSISGSQINLTWTGSTDNVGVTGYLIERCTGTNCTSFDRQTTIPGTTYNDTGLTPNTSYTYQVKATDAAGNFSSYSNQSTATTSGTVSGLVAAYTFDEGSGTTVTDFTGGGHNGTIANGTWTNSGKYGKAIVFNGTSTIVTIPDAPALRLTTGMTLEAWVNPSQTLSGWDDLVYKGNDNYGLEASSNPSGTPAIGGTFGSTDVFAPAPAPLTPATWTHLAGTYDGTAIKLYVNGAQVASSAQSAALLTSANPLQIGGDSIFGQFFRGTIDEVRVYNVALNQSQIQADMALPVGSGSVPVLSLGSSSVTFPGQQTGTTSSPTPVTVSNTGTASLTITSVAVSGGSAGDFSQTNNCVTTLAPAASCTINITFAPTTTGSRSSSVSINDNAVGSPHSISLAGMGTGFQISPRVVALTFTRTQQFTPSSGTVSWTVDGVAGGNTTVGTITTDGLYTPPAVLGTHTITGTVVGQSTAASSTVYLTNTAGIFTHHNDNMRSGVNSTETVLTQSNVNQVQFGKLFSYPLDGVSYTSPLYVANVNISGQGFHNVLYMGTEHDTMYAFDADGLSSTPLWQKSFLSSGVTTVPCADVGECGDIQTEIGITGTPVIDQSSNTMYVVAKTKEGTNYVQRLHALDITSGAEKFGGPVVISASVPGNGNGSTGGNMPFDPLRENQRPGLTLINGVVYMAFSSHGDKAPWHGWVLGYNATTLAQTMKFCVSPDDNGGGIWQSGLAPAADSSGNIYFTTANGNFNVSSGGKNYGDTVIKMNAAGSVVDYFTPFDQSTMDTGNFDLSSAGPALLVDQPGTVSHLMVTAAKGGTIYVLNRDNMGHFHSGSDSQIYQTIPNAVAHGGSEEGNYSAPVFFNNRIYYAAINDNLKTFQLQSGFFTTTPTSQSAVTYPTRGGAFSVSANGSSSGILWAIQDNNPSNGVLRAYDPNNLATEFYNSNQAGTRDNFGVAVKFAHPVVINGKVYVMSQGQVVVYGLLP